MSSLSRYLDGTPLGAGDVVLVHSSLRALGEAGRSADGVIDAFLEVLTPRGVLAVPTHTWATVSDQQPVFHEWFTPSTVGTLTNVLRKREGAVRSLHPSHSVAAIGERAGAFVAGHELDETPCGPGSPYAKLIEWGAYVGLLGVDLSRCTFIHHLEQLAGHAAHGLLTEKAGARVLIRRDGSVLHTRAYCHSGHTSDKFPRVEGLLRESGAMTVSAFGAGELRLLDARRTAEVLVPKLRAEPKLFY